MFVLVSYILRTASKNFQHNLQLSSYLIYSMWWNLTSLHLEGHIYIYIYTHTHTHTYIHLQMMKSWKQVSEGEFIRILHKVLAALWLNCGSGTINTGLQTPHFMSSTQYVSFWKYMCFFNWLCKATVNVINFFFT